MTIARAEAAKIIAKIMACDLASYKVGDWEGWHPFLPKAVECVDELARAGVTFQEPTVTDRVNEQLKTIFPPPPPPPTDYRGSAPNQDTGGRATDYFRACGLKVPMPPKPPRDIREGGFGQSRLPQFIKYLNRKLKQR